MEKTDRKKEAVRFAAEAMTGLLLIFLMFLSLELGCHNKTLAEIFSIEAKYLVLNLLTLCSFFALIWLVCGNMSAAKIAFTFACTIIAAVNYYVIEWHGTPLSISDLKNTGTALNVLGEYKIEIFKPVGYIFLLFLFAAALTLLQWTFAGRGGKAAKNRTGGRAGKKDGHSKDIQKSGNRIRSALRRRAGILLFAAASLCVTVILGRQIAPHNPLSVHWTMGYHKYGFVVCAVSREVNYNQVTKPEGYDSFSFDSLGTIFEGKDGEEKAEETAGTKEAKEMEQTQNTSQAGEESLRPDIILILNETFYDLNRITEIRTDCPYLEFFYGLDNVTRGYAVVHDAGGGTNKSEYELLTGNSEHLMPGITPFNELNLKGANSVVSFLESLGYSTLAAHPFSGNNYNRKTGYSDLGFDKVHFQPDFENREFYYNRKFTSDQSAYENFLKWYGQESESPRFMYMLTIQNHGAYEQNDPEVDTVHVLEEYGGLEDQMNEYLTSVKMSDDAFRELITYFESVDRPVYVCMVGDHCPSFAVNFAKKYAEGNEYEVAVRSVPFVIWSNVRQGRGDIGTISLNYLLPTLLEEAGLGLSDYYRYLTLLREEVPVLSDIEFYRDAEGNYYEYESESPYKEKVDACFYMEYNNVKDTERRQELFEPRLTQDMQDPEQLEQ